MLLDAVPTVGKNGQQIASAISKQVKVYSKLLNAFCNTTRAETALIVHVQVGCIPLEAQQKHVVLWCFF